MLDALTTRSQETVIKVVGTLIAKERRASALAPLGAPAVGKSRVYAPVR